MPYKIKLPNQFLYWWLIITPIKILKMGMALLATADNQMSFLANIKLLFVPLFGITNFTGKVISFFARILMITFGLIFMLCIFVFVFISPLAWVYAPIFIFRTLSLPWALLYLIGLYLLWAMSNLNIPNKKIYQLPSASSKMDSFRPKVRYILGTATSNYEKMIEQMLSENQILVLLKKAELDIDEFKSKIIKNSKYNYDELVSRCFNYALENKSRYVEPEHLFLSILSNTPNIETVLSVFNSSLDSVKQTAFWIVRARENMSKLYVWQEDYVLPPTGGIGKGMLGRVTPNLDSVSTDITKEVRKGNVKDIVGRDKEIKEISEILEGDKNDILIIGESGIGKTSIVNGIAYDIMAGTKYKTIKNKRVVSLDIGTLIAGNESSGKVAERLTTILKEAESSGDIILFIDEMQNLVTGMGEEGGYDSTIFSILENYISKNKIRIIGSITMENYRKYIEKNEAISRLFQIIEIQESSKEDTIEILKISSREMEIRHGILITYPAIIASIDLSEKLIHDRVLPDKAKDVIERAASSVKNSTKYLTSNEIENEISEMTKIPITAIEKNEADKLLNLGNEMRKRVIGQDQAIQKIEIALQRARTGIRNESKPIAGFLFVGMTGVGKTETARSLLSCYFGEEKNLVRLDMSEYQQIDSIDRIIGSSDGRISGTLSEKVRNSPFSLVLIDEMEKAHPNILLTFLQILDEGRLTDTAGNEVNFTNTIIIATSNVGTKSIQKVSESGGSYDDMQKAAMIDIREKFAPELLNRFTSIIVFNPLNKDDLRKITEIMLSRVKKTVEEKNIEVHFKPELLDELIKRGYSVEWGARPLARVIEDSVESYLAVKILKKEINPGDKLILGTEVFGI
jgi:ATP-dependent Clp protease ATP-binding subunit ClpA